MGLLKDHIALANDMDGALSEMGVAIDAILQKKDKKLEKTREAILKIRDDIASRERRRKADEIKLIKDDAAYHESIVYALSNISRELGLIRGKVQIDGSSVAVIEEAVKKADELRRKLWSDEV